MSAKTKATEEINRISEKETDSASQEAVENTEKTTLSALEARIAQLEAMLEKQKKQPAAPASALPAEVIENEKRMREQVEFYVPVDPINRENTDLKVMNPITESLMILKRGERVKIPKCVYEILQHSDEQNIVVADMSEKLAREYEESEK